MNSAPVVSALVMCVEVVLLEVGDEMMLSIATVVGEVVEHLV